LEENVVYELFLRELSSVVNINLEEFKFFNFSQCSGIGPLSAYVLPLLHNGNLLLGFRHYPYPLN